MKRRLSHALLWFGACLPILLTPRALRAQGCVLSCRNIYTDQSSIVPPLPYSIDCGTITCSPSPVVPSWEGTPVTCTSYTGVSCTFKVYLAAIHATTVPFPPKTDIEGLEVLGHIIAYSDFGPANQLLAYSYEQLGGDDYIIKLQQAIPVKDRLFAVGSATVGDGIVFLGDTQGQAQLAQLTYGQTGFSLSTFPLQLDLSQFGGIKGNSEGDFIAWSTATGTLAAHWNDMPLGQVNYVPQPVNSSPIDAAWDSSQQAFRIINNGTETVARVPRDRGPLTYIPLTFAPASITIGPDGIMLVSSPNAIHEFTPTGQETGQIPVNKVLNLSFTQSGHLVGVQRPATLVLFNGILQPEISYTLPGNVVIFDYRIVPGRRPLTILVNEFDRSSKIGGVAKVTIDGFPADRDNSSDRFGPDWPLLLIPPPRPFR